MRRLEFKNVERLAANFVRAVEALRDSLVELKIWHTTPDSLPLRYIYDSNPELLGGYVDAECRRNLALVELQRQKTV